MNPLPAVVLSPAGPLAWNSRAFGYNVNGTAVPLGPFKFFLNNPSVLTSLASDPQSANYIQAGCFDGSGHWWGVRYNTNALVKIDTSTGTITMVATVIGASSITGLAWDRTTSTMYASDYNTVTNKIGTINLTTGVFTPLGGNIGPGILTDIAFSNKGNLYGHMITGSTTQSQIYKNGNLLGPTGFIAQYAQGMSWDRESDTGYLAAFNYTTNMGELRRIDTVTGATTFVGNFGCEVDGFAIPCLAGPKLVHTPLPNTQNYNGPYVVTVIISDVCSTIASAKIYWSRNNPVVTDSVNMTNSSGDNWTGSIPGNGTTSTYRYYIKITDMIGRVAVAPSGAPTTLYMFVVMASDTSKPVITHTPIGNTPKNLWPVTVYCIASEPFGVDSVWVRWNKNSGSFSKFNLTQGSGYNWSGIFNSDTSQVVPGDRIYYRIIARSASTQHTKDSTALYSFLITNPSLYSISGNVKYNDNNQIVTSGTVKAFKLDKNSGNIIFLDSAQIQPNGNYVMVNIPNDSLDIGVYPSSTGQVDYVTTYYPSTTYWRNATILYPTGNLTNINVSVFRMNTTTANNSVSGRIVQHNMNPIPSLKDANVYAINGNSFVGCTISDGNGRYHIQSLATGNLKFIVDRLGFGGDSTFVNVTPTSIIDSINFSLNPMFVNVKKIDEIIPDSYFLFQNYPNPFNPTTIIRYQIKDSKFVTLKVFDVLGREVATLVNEFQKAGTYETQFPNNPVTTNELPSGIYLYTLQSGDFKVTKKLILIK
jgi:6-phosphogluconolactonase (cycloisomerase 2 family)